VATTKKVALTPARSSAVRTSGVVLLGPSSKVRQTHLSGSGSGSGGVCTDDAGTGETKLSSGSGVRSLSRQPTTGSAPQNIPSPNPAAAPAESSRRLTSHRGALPNLKKVIPKNLLVKSFLHGNSIYKI